MSTISKRDLYAAGEPLGSSATQRKLGGGYVCGDGGGGGEQTSVTRTEPSEAVKPYLAPYMERVKNVADRPYQTYQGQRVADLSQDHLNAMNMVRNQAANNAPVNAASEALTGVLGGAGKPGANAYAGKTTDVASNPYYGQNNPYLQQSIDNASQDVIKGFNTGVFPQEQARQAMAGTWGSANGQSVNDRNNATLADQLGRLSTNMRMQDYTQQQQLGEAAANRATTAQQTDLARNAGISSDDMNRGLSFQENQLRAAGLAPGISDARYQDAQKLLGVGDIQTEDKQLKLDQQYNDWLGGQNYPLSQLDIIGNGLRTTMGGGGSSATTAPALQRNRAAGAIGGGVSGAYLGSQMGGGNPYATAGGAVLGGLLGSQ